MKLFGIRGVLVEAMALSLAVPSWVVPADTKEIREKEERVEKKAMDNEQIKRFQQLLKAKGEDPGPIDGVIGKKTSSALRAFQKTNDLKVTGTLDDQTAEKLATENHTFGRDAISPGFDFREMAKQSLGAEWYRRTFNEQTEFVKLFADFLNKAVVRRIEPYSNKVIYAGESVDQSYAEVDSKLLLPRGEEFKINYLLHRLQSEWKIYDLVIEDVSLVNNYRAQFRRVISKSSYEELVRRIKQKSGELDGILAMLD